MGGPDLTVLLKLLKCVSDGDYEEKHLDALRAAFQQNRVVPADRSVDAGRDIVGSVVITGDKNQFVFQLPPPAQQAISGPQTAARTDIHHLPSTGKLLIGRGGELGRLTRAWNRAATNVISVVADGGIGKSALVNHWLASMAANDYRGARRVYGWSAYSQGTKDRVTSADLFIEQALRFFGAKGDLSPSVDDRALLLAKLVREEPTLLVLDGIEPLQYPPGPGEGQIKDLGVRILVRELAAQNPGLCVITTRVAVRELDDFESTVAPRIDLGKLQPSDGARLLRKLGVKLGTPEELETASEEFDGHPLALTLLGTYLRDARAGDIAKRHEIRPLETQLEHGDHAWRVMDSYETWLEPGPETQILRILGLFERPAESGAIEALRREPAVDGLNDQIVGLDADDWTHRLTRLRHAGLIAEEDPATPGMLDAHPLVRQHFGRKLRKENDAAWRAGHDRLFEYCRGPGCPKQLPDTPQEMAPLYAAVAHGCNARRHQETLDEVYWERIQRKEETYSAKKLGAFGSDLTALSGFFDRPWTTPVVALSDEDKAFLLSETAFRLRALGRLNEAIEPMMGGLDAHIAGENWENAATSASNLSELHLTLGRIGEAIALAERSVKYADQSGDAFQRMSKRARLADALCQAGRLEDAEKRFQEAEAMEKDRQLEFSLLCGLQGYQYCDLLLERGRHEEVHDRATQTLEWATDVFHFGLLSIGLDHLSLARAAFPAAESGSGEALDRARLHAQTALDTLRQAGQQDHLPRGLLTRAEVHRRTKDFAAARSDLAEAMAVALRDPAGPMKLHQTDCHLALARVDLASGRATQAQEHVQSAAELIEETGYHRRDGELERLRERD